MSCRGRGLCALLAVIATAASVATAAAAEAASGPAVRSCALGKLPRSLSSLVPNRIAGAEDRFVDGLPGLGRDGKRHAHRVFAAAEAAYLYGFPPVATRLTVQAFPLNVLVGVGHLATPDSRAVVAPNSDTLYSVSQIDLGNGPMVVDAPDTGGRYSVLQLLDAYTNAVGYVGSGSDRDRAEAVLLAGPGWHGDAPPGVRVLRSPTNLIWLLGRTLVDDEADVPAATELMKQYALTKLADWELGTRRPEIVLSATGPQPPIEVPDGPAFYDALSSELVASPPPARDDCALGVFARAGIGPGAQPSATTDPIVVAALAAAPKAGLKLLDRAVVVTSRKSRKRHNGWGLPPADAAKFGIDYADRAVIARSLLGVNTVQEALYPGTDVDSGNRVLRGKNRYVIRMDGDQLPPVRAFWSMTLYDADFFLVDNPLDRFAIGDRTPGLDFGRDGSLKIYVQHDPPHGAKADNWLPAPRGKFSLRLRLFEPKRAALGRRWEPPRVKRVG